MLIHLEKLGKSFGEKIVLHDVTASVEREDRIGIVGQNGAGKTTLLKILTGVYTDYDGEFSVTHGVTLGYLEQMYGGVSGEVLWKPVDSRLALGLEVNYAKQRDFNQLLAFRDYDVVTGHASAYYDFGKGFVGQVDVGRYLAGDVGATLALDRYFANGWRVGAYATFTDMPTSVFGEGSFDKGIRLTIPLAFATATPSAKTFTTTLKPLNRDGGARLAVDGRLYELVRDSHQGTLQDRWGRFWR